MKAITSPAKPKGPYQGAVGTLAAGTIWSGIFGSVYVPVRAAVDATAPLGEPWWGPSLAAAVGSVAASSVRVPKQVVKARMEKGEFFCSLQAFERILLREGPAGLYGGWARSVAKNAPFDALLFLLYDTGKSALTRSRAPPSLDESTAAAADYTVASGDSLTTISAAAAAAEAEAYGPWDAALVGGAAGAATGLLTSPLEFARQAWQEGAQRGGASPAARSAGVGCAAAAAAACGHGGRGHAAGMRGAGSGAGSGAAAAGLGAPLMSRGMMRYDAGAVHTATAAAGEAPSPPPSPSPYGPAHRAQQTELTHGSAHSRGGGGGSSPVRSWWSLRQVLPTLANAPAATCGGGGWATWRLIAGSVRSRVLWSALEGAVFFPSLELAIPLCDWLFLPPPADGAGEAAASGGGGEGGWGLTRDQGHGPLRHPAHPLHW